MFFEMTGRVGEEQLTKSQKKGKSLEGADGGIFKEYYRRKSCSGMSGFARKRRRQIEEEFRIKKEQYEEYIKMLRASSLKRKLQEQETDRRFAQSSVARDVALGAYGLENIKKYNGFF